MTDPIARHGQLPRRSALVTVLRAIGIVLAVAVVSTIGVTAFAIWDVANSARPSVDLPGQDEVPPEIGAIEGEVNLLLVGSDSGGGDAAFGERGEVLNDVTMLLHISADKTHATVLSFPRDLYVPIPECPNPDGGTFGPYSSEKINTSLSYGGLPCTVATVQQLTGISIPFAAVIEFQGVIAMSDAVGGVPVCVAERIEDEHTGVFLDPGEHTLQGVDALQFLRTRYGLSSGSDLARISNQQVFLSSLVRTIRSSETLSNPVKVYALAKAALSNTVTSTSLSSPDTMVSIALALRDIPLDQVVFIQYPSYEADNGLYPVEVDAAAVAAAIAADQRISLSGSTGQGAQVDPNAAPVPAPDPNATTAPSADPSTSPTAPPDAPVVLPPGVTGQDASQRTCSVGRTLNDQ